MRGAPAPRGPDPAGAQPGDRGPARRGRGRRGRAALTGTVLRAPHEGRVYELSGPRLLTFAEAVEEIALAADREIGYVRVSMQEYETLLRAQRVPVQFAALLRYVFKAPP